MRELRELITTVVSRGKEGRFGKEGLDLVNFTGGPSGLG